MELIKSLGIACGVLATMLTLMGIIYKMFLKKWWTKRQAAKKAEWNKMLSDISEIKGQVFPNGGGSIVDMQNRIMAQIKAILQTVGTLSAGQRNILDIMEIPSWESDHEGRVTFVNNALCELIGATPADLMGNSWVGRVAYFNRDQVVREWRQSVENASDFNLPHSLKMADGKYQKVQPSVIHNKNEEGKVLNSLGRLVKVGEPYKYEKQ